MRTTRSIFAKVCGSAIGAAGLLQALTCDVQYPPDNTDCIRTYGVCIARPKLPTTLGEMFVGEADLE